MNRKFLFLLLVLLISAKVQAQVGRSPFTTFGLGEPYGNYLIQNQGMGGIGVSQPQTWFLNNFNPALLIHNNYTVFQAGIMGESRTIRSNSQAEKQVGGNLNYLVTAFPIKSGRWTTSVGLMPYTTVDYSITYDEYALDKDGVRRDTLIARESGTGGVTQFYWANGVRINKNFSVGLRAAYLFGPIETNYSNQTTHPEQLIRYRINIEEKTVVKDFLLTTGVAFTKDSLWRKKAYRFNAGLVYSLKSNLKATRSSEISTLNSSDQVLYTSPLFTNKGSIFIPGAFTGGVSWSRGNKWTVATEISYQDWSSFSSVSGDDEGLGESWRTALGGEITPDPLAGDNYLKRITYRLGAAYENYPFLVNGNPLRDFGINFGFSLPAGRSSLDLAFKVGKRGNRNETILEESYFKLYFGMTFNDQWFIKRKFD